MTHSIYFYTSHSCMPTNYLFLAGWLLSAFDVRYNNQ
jgi:hypothetical protein